MRLTTLVFRRLATAPWPCAPPQSNPLSRAPPLLPLQEKKGSPLFMPLMNERGVEAVAVGTKGPDANAV